MINTVVLQGRLTADPELKETYNRTPVTSFSIAVDRSYTPEGQERQADFINIVAWRQTAEFICKYFAKGRMIALEGAIQTRNYEDKNGNKRTAFEVVARQVHFCGGKNDNNGQPTNSSTNKNNSRPAQSNPNIKPDQNDFTEPQPGETFSVGDFDDFNGFEEIGTDDSDLPF